MSENPVLDTLLLPFERGDVPWHDSTLFLRADFHPSLQACDVSQIYKPAADRLNAHGFKNREDIAPSYGLILIDIPKQVQEALGLIAQGVRHLADDGTLVLCAGNDANGKRLEKWLEEAGFDGIQTDSKNKSRVVWAKKPSKPASEVLNQWANDAAPRIFGDYQTQPGLFSWDSIDRASQLLAENLPALKGNVADFGCGWGYLSREVLKKFPSLTSLTLIDADSRAVASAAANVKDVQAATQINSFWHDLTKALPTSMTPFDFIIMNPPFHTGKKTDLDLGLSFIRTAWAQLKKGGTLYMVANAHLRYEDALAKLFGTTDLLIQKNGFKIIRARK